MLWEAGKGESSCRFYKAHVNHKMPKKTPKSQGWYQKRKDIYCRYKSINRVRRGGGRREANLIGCCGCKGNTCGRCCGCRHSGWSSTVHHGYLEKKITQGVESDPPPKKTNFLLSSTLSLEWLVSTGREQTRESDPFSSCLDSPTAPAIRILKQLQMCHRRDTKRRWGKSLGCRWANWQMWRAKFNSAWQLTFASLLAETCKHIQEWAPVFTKHVQARLDNELFWGLEAWNGRKQTSGGGILYCNKHQVTVGNLKGLYHNAVPSTKRS